MGLDLDLTMEEHESKDSSFSGYTRISLSKDSHLFAQIDDIGGYAPDIKSVCEPIVLFDEIYWYDDEGVKKIKNDAYGYSLTYVYPPDLGKVDASKSTQWNRAVWTMIAALPPDTKIVLYWR